MSQITPEKLRELKALVERAPPILAKELLVMFERLKLRGTSSIPIGELIESLRRAHEEKIETAVRLPGFDRMFFEPFEDLLDTGDASGTLLPGSLSRNGLTALWDYLTGLVPKLYAELEPSVRLAILAGNQTDADVLLERFRIAILERLEVDKEASGHLANCPDFQPMGAAIHHLLVAHRAIRKLEVALVTPQGDINPDVERILSDRLNKFEAKDPVAAQWFGLYLMTKLKRPAQVFRVLAKGSIGLDDQKLESTEYAVLGHRLMEIAKRAIVPLNDVARGQNGNAAELAEVIKETAGLLTAMEREGILNKSGPWRNEILSIRKKFSDLCVQLCSQATEIMDNALPVDRVKVKGKGLIDRPRVTLTPRDDRVARAEFLIGFVSKVRLYASLAGFASAREKAEKDILRQIDVLVSGIMAMRGEPDQGEIEVWRKATRRIILAADGQDAAQMFDRRLAA